jgi:TPR repeat protein
VWLCIFQGGKRVKSGQEQGHQPLFDTKVAYADWMQALLDDFEGKKVEVARALIQILVELTGVKMVRDDREAFKNRIGHWFNGRHSAPLGEDPNRENSGPSAESMALIELMVRRQIKPPASSQNRDFEEVLTSLQKQRTANRLSGGVKPKELDLVALHEDRILAYPALKASNLNFAQVGLGSAYFENQAPPYNFRDVDDQILQKLNTPETRFVIVSGAPKSGKTRTLLEKLKDSNLSNANILWLDPSPGVLQLFLERTVNANMSNTVVMLDDIQKFGFDAANGITLSRLKQLSERTKVLVTVHADSLNALTRLELVNYTTESLNSEQSATPNKLSKSQLTNRPAVRQSLAESTIEVAQELTNNEFHSLSQETKDLLSLEDFSKGCQLASIYASIDELEEKATNLYKRGDSSSALLRAVVAAYPVSSSGMTDEAIIKIAELIYLKLHPNGRIKLSLFDSPFDFLTQGVVPGSDKAILIKESGSANKFLLLDGLWERLKHIVPKSDFALVEQTLDQESRLDFGSNLWWHFDFEEEALSIMSRLESEGFLEAFSVHAHFFNESNPELEKEILLKAAQMNFAKAQNRLGVLAYAADDNKTAKEWYTKAANQNFDWAQLNLGTLASDEGDLETAKEWYTKAANQGLAEAQNRLGVLIARDGDKEKAKEWYTKAAEQNFDWAQHNLAMMASDEGDLETAKDWYTKAANQGLPQAQNRLGVLLADSGDKESAKEWYTKAADQNFDWAQLNLGTLASDEGDLETAKEWHTKAANQGLADAQNYLGVLLANAGDKESAKEWYTKAADQNLDWAQLNLGSLANDEGDLETAKDWYTKAANQGLAQAQNRLGVLLADSGDLEKAKEWYTKAANQGLAQAQNRLGVLLADSGDLEKAREWYTKAADQNYDWAQLNLGVLACKSGDIEGGKDWYTKAANQGLADAQNYLGVLLSDAGDLIGALEWYTKAANQNFDWAQHNLGGMASDAGDVDAAKEWYTKAANQGLAEAQNRLGVLLADAGDKESAKEWYTKAADQNFDWAQHNLGSMASSEGDLDAAKDWFTKAANQGLAEAQNRLAVILRDSGEIEQANAWFVMAAESGNDWGQYNLARNFEMIGDLESAISWYSKSAELGLEEARVRLGELSSDTKGKRLPRAQGVALKDDQKDAKARRLHRTSANLTLSQEIDNNLKGENHQKQKKT